VEIPRVDLDHLRDLMKLMDQFDFDELDVRDDGKRLHLSRSGRAPKGSPPAVVMPTMMAAPGAAPAAAPDGEAAASGELPAGIKVITSPMVGTFYRAASPDSAPFVEEGADVGENSVLCIIEAMKVMNEIKAECSGELVKILVANGEAVEYGEPLFHVRTS
jgi:acetyl-CoA carboxylase biotin carboxyl carrier protein